MASNKPDRPAPRPSPEPESYICLSGDIPRAIIEKISRLPGKRKTISQHLALRNRPMRSPSPDEISLQSETTASSIFTAQCELQEPDTPTTVLSTSSSKRYIISSGCPTSLTSLEPSSIAQQERDNDCPPLLSVISQIDAGLNVSRQNLTQLTDVREEQGGFNSRNTTHIDSVSLNDPEGSANVKQTTLQDTGACQANLPFPPHGDATISKPNNGEWGESILQLSQHLQLNCGISTVPEPKRISNVPSDPILGHEKFIEVEPLKQGQVSDRKALGLQRKSVSPSQNFHAGSENKRLRSGGLTITINPKNCSRSLDLTSPKPSSPRSNNRERLDPREFKRNAHPPPSFPADFYEKIGIETTGPNSSSTQVSPSRSSSSSARPRRLENSEGVPRSTSKLCSDYPKERCQQPRGGSPKQSSFYDKTHYFTACPHSNPPLSRPLNAQPYLDPNPILSNNIMVNRSVIDGACFTCDTDRRRNQEHATLLKYNNRLESLVRQLRAVVEEAENSSHAETTGTGDEFSVGIVPTHSTSTVSQVDLTVDSLDSAIAELKRQEEVEIKNVWHGYTERWGPATLGIHKLRPTFSSRVEKGSNRHIYFQELDKSLAERSRDKPKSGKTPPSTIKATDGHGCQSLLLTSTLRKEDVPTATRIGQGSVKMLVAHPETHNFAPSINIHNFSSPSSQTAPPQDPDRRFQARSNILSTRRRNRELSLDPGMGRMRVHWIRPERPGGEKGAANQ